MSEQATPSVINKWALAFRLVAQTRDYGGRGRPINGDQRKPAWWVAKNSMKRSAADVQVRTNTVITSIEAWRLAAKDGLVPHPGMIPNGATKLQDVPGWESAEYPEVSFYTYWHRVPVNPVLPLRWDTQQCPRAPLISALPSGCEIIENKNPSAFLGFLVGLLHRAIDMDAWTEVDRLYWQSEVVPVLNDLLDCEVWNERKRA